MRNIESASCSASALILALITINIIVNNEGPNFGVLTMIAASSMMLVMAFMVTKK